MTRLRRLAPGLALVLALLCSSCATSHLIEWSQGRPSTYSRPSRNKSIYVRAGGTVVAFPFALAWDVVTFPFQWIWDVHPYGPINPPEDFEGS
ncbi:MAG: hypothetical protein IPM29_02620 [Planctomycetes bacterium]|nr:hypothetical protein [Planctomycetota bacterium]